MTKAVPVISTPVQGLSDLKLVVTSGGTSVPIDSVRRLGNDSSGTTGALIAEAALEHGHFVHYLFSRDSKTPYNSLLTIDHRLPVEDEIARITRDAHAVVPLLRNSEFERVNTFHSYRERILELAANSEFDAVILAMAASDYGPNFTEGKISSDQDELIIRLKALPKIISEIKKERPQLFLVGFKLLINESPDVLIDKAYRNLLRDNQDLAVANVGKDSMKPKDMLTYIVTAEKGVIPVERDLLPETLMRLIETRHSRRYFSTELNKVEKLPVGEDDLASFIGNLHMTSQLALFNAYLPDRREEFGFVAQRVSSGTLITGRGSSKSAATIEDLSVVHSVDLEKRKIVVSSVGKKASLNASIAHLIFESRPDINYIVHAHIKLPEAQIVSRDTSPATAEDWEVIEPLVKSGCNLIEQPNHGVMILLKEMRDIFDILARNSVYVSHAEHYDTAYHRFLSSNRLLSIFGAHVEKDAPILDLAAGTGEVTKQLLIDGFSNITLADQSLPMLQAAQRKLGHLIDRDKFVQASFQSLPFNDQFAAIIIRQAINYLAPDQLVSGFKQFYRALRQGGNVIFNSFDPGSIEERLRRLVREEVGGKILITHEANYIEGKKLFHGQRTEMFDAYSGDYQLIYDLNSFWIYGAEDLRSAALMAGFSEVELITEGNSHYFVCNK